MAYYGIAFILSLLSFKDINSKYKFSGKIIFWIVTFLTLFSGIRYRVGYDWINYENIFLYTPKLSSLLSGEIEYILTSRIEMGFLLLTSITKQFTNEVNGLYVVVSLIILCLILLRLKEYTPHVYLSLLLFFVSSYLNYNFGLLRQGIAVALFFYSIKYILERNIAKYFLFNIIACFFHFSAIVVLPFYFILRKQYHRSVIIFTIIISILLSYIDWPSLLISRFGGHLAAYLTDEKQGVVISLLSLGVLLKFLILFVGFILRNILETKYRYYNIMLNLYYYHVILFLLFRQSFVFGARIPLYFTIADMVLLTYFLRVDKNPYIRMIILLIIIFYSFVLLYFMMSKGVYIPYITIFQN